VEVGRLHHVAFAHGQGERPFDAFATLLGIEVVHREEADGFTERMSAVGDCYLQTLESTGPGVVQRFLDRRGPGLHHVAFTVADLDAALAELRAQGARLVDEQPRPGGMGTRIAFLHPSTFGGVLVELVEERDPAAGGQD
jgi:methylmalonyl-CoA/ethylmalonyl-CoA epimerase